MDFDEVIKRGERDMTRAIIIIFWTVSEREREREREALLTHLRGMSDSVRMMEIKSLHKTHHHLISCTKLLPQEGGKLNQNPAQPTALPGATRKIHHVKCWILGADEIQNEGWRRQQRASHTHHRF
jgi:hypothetical protein